MLTKIAPVICLILAIMMLVFGFATLAIEPPGESQALHRARVQGLESTSEILEKVYRRHRWNRSVLIAGLFAGSILMTVLAFALMGDKDGLAPEITKSKADKFN